MNVPPISPAATYSAPLARKIPPADTASDVSTVASAGSRLAPAQYVSKPDRDAVFEETGLRITADAIPIPPIALQIAAERRAGVSTAHAYARAVADPVNDTARQVLRNQQAGLDVIA